MKQLRVYGSSDLSAQLSNYAASMGVSRDLIATAERINPEFDPYPDTPGNPALAPRFAEILKSAGTLGLVSAKPTGEVGALRHCRLT